MIVDHVVELLAPFKYLPVLEDIDKSVENELQLRPTTTAEVGSDDWKKFWRYQSHFTLEFCKAIEKVLPTGLSIKSYNHLTNDLRVVIDNG